MPSWLYHFKHRVCKWNEMMDIIVNELLSAREETTSGCSDWANNFLAQVL